MTPASSQTRWSLVERAKGDSPQARAALADLCAIYYAPVHGFVRRWCQGMDEEARDLTQAFFAQVLVGRSLNGAESGQGRFRSYLFGAVKHFISSLHRDARASKRGGGVVHEGDEAAMEVADTRSLPPDAEFDRAWACAVLDRTLILLENEMRETGKLAVFAELKPWLAGTAAHGDTAAAATRLGVSETAVRVLLSRLRKRMRERLRAELAQTLVSEADVDAEMRHLAEALTAP